MPRERTANELTLHGVLVSFVAVGLDNAKVAHADLREVLRERIGAQNARGEEAPEAFERFVHRPFLFEQEPNGVQLTEDVHDEENLHPDVEKEEIGVKHVRAADDAADQALRVGLDFAVLLLQSLPWIADVLMDE